MRYLILLFVTAFSQILPAEYLYAVIDVSIAPNYFNRSGEFDFSVLSDGRATNKSMWKSNTAATWVKPVPIMLKIEIDEAGVGELHNAGVSLDFHFGNREKVGVYLPLRIDVYDNTGSAIQYRHIGEWQRSGVDQTAENGWIALNINYLPKNIAVVIHAGGKVMSMDELVFRRNGNLAGNSEAGIGVKLRPIEDSFERLKKYQDRHLKVSERKAPLLRILTPYYDLTGGEDRSEGVEKNITLLENPHSYITIVAEGFLDNTCLRIEADEPLEVYQLEYVYSIRGRRVYDVVTPYGKCLYTEEGYPTYVMVKSRLTNFSEAVEPSYIRVLDDSGKLHYAVTVSHKVKNEAEDLVKDCISVAPYSYSNEFPAWNDKDKMYNILHDAGVNTFFIPPRNFPFIDDAGSQRRNDIALQRFRKELELYSSAKNVIFFAALDKKFDWSQPRIKIEEKLGNWIDLLENEIASGEHQFRFFVQPIDEAKGEDWEKVLIFAEILKGKRRSNIGLYLNPIYKNNDSRRSIYLNKLKNYVDIWQPNLKFISKVPRNEYLSEQSELWFYNNPYYPPKEVAPSFYAGLVEVANQEKLSGVGFWSITSSKKSSPWYDWDGVQPDYGLFYEKEGALYPSLRWLAFVSKINEPCALGL